MVAELPLLSPNPLTTLLLRLSLAPASIQLALHPLFPCYRPPRRLPRRPPRRPSPLLLPPPSSRPFGSPRTFPNTHNGTCRNTPFVPSWRHAHDPAHQSILHPRAQRVSTMACHALWLLLIVVAALPALVAAQNNLATMTRNITGTWSTGSGAVLTGIGFYNPVTRSFTIPPTAGESYSFTADGHWEQAIVKWIANPSEPNCPTLHAIWQHGTYEFQSNNDTLHLTPFWGDGHQYMSSYCNSQYAPSIPDTGPTTLGGWMGVSDNVDGHLAAYNQAEEYQLPMFEIDLHYGVSVDVMRLRLPSGRPKSPLYKYYDPPMMLPIERLHVEIYGAP
ncbi:Reversal of tor2 lethality [Thecaphora frezii]